MGNMKTLIASAALPLLSLLIPPAAEFFRRKREEQFHDFLYAVAAQAWLTSCSSGDRNDHARR
jgi:hypothetical protein